MRLVNTSRYPTAEVRRLIGIGARGISLDLVEVHVKNSASGLRGRTYLEIGGRMRVRDPFALYLITIGIGPESTFPHDNMIDEYRWEPVSEAEYEAMPEDEQKKLRHQTNYSGGVVVGHSYSRSVVRRHPYGGLRAPLIEEADWREGMVSIAAHEARHVDQYRRKRPGSEVDAERFAARALDRYREALR